MTEQHFPVWEWEPGDPVDEAHLSECPKCQRRWEALEFLRYQAKHAPAPDPAPFFASRVAHLAFSDAVTVWDLLERAARRLTPVFASLSLAAVIGLALWTPSEIRSPTDDYAELLVEPEAEGELTLDDVLYSLSLPLQEESTIEDQ